MKRNILNYFICGFSGAGKSTLLKSLEKNVVSHLILIDLDEYITSQYLAKDDSIANFINVKGISEFRNLEFKAISLISEQDNILLSLGGGSLTNQTLSILKDWKGFWLNTNFETCWERIRDDDQRPLTKLGKEKMRELFLERKELYSKYLTIENHEDLIHYLNI